VLLVLGADIICIDLGSLGQRSSSQRSFFVKMVSASYHRAMTFRMMIGLGEDKNPLNFGFTRSKVKVTRITFEKTM